MHLQRVSIISNNDREKHDATDARKYISISISRMPLEKRMRTVLWKCRQICQARLLYQSLSEVFKYHHLDVICEIRNFVTDGKAVCVHYCYNQATFRYAKIRDLRTGCFSIACVKMDLLLPFDAISCPL